MRRILFTVCLLCASLWLCAQQADWSRTMMDGSRTGCTPPGRDNVAEALGTVDGRVYTAPNGKVFKGGSAAKVAKAMLDAQPAMADVKQVVGYSEKGMRSRGANSPLANFATEALIAGSEKIFGRKADFAVMNSGGIRASVEPGTVLKDDIMAIFPFKNYLCLVEYPGTVLLEFLERQASQRHAHPFAGVEMTVKDRRLVSATIGGRQIDPQGTYYLATIDFVLGPGDNMWMGRGARNIQRSQTLVFDVIMDYIMYMTGAGRTLDCEVDDRLIYLE